MKKILVANWKNHPASLSETKKLVVGLSRQAKLYKKLATIIAPPSAYLETVSGKIKSYASLGSQDLFALDGTHTGALGVDILQSFGVKVAILGHSERRALGESDKMVSGKVRTAIKAGIMPLVCIGERVRDHEGSYFEFLSEELKHSLEGVRKNEVTKLIIAYEPIWAIGKKAKDAMQPTDLAQMLIFIKKVLTEIFGRAIAEKIPVIYGGSVESGNVEELVNIGVKGFLVGHASLDAKQFSKIAEALIQ
jgi:triosephosphate isomerase